MGPKKSWEHDDSFLQGLSGSRNRLHDHVTSSITATMEKRRNSRTASTPTKDTKKCKEVVKKGSTVLAGHEKEEDGIDMTSIVVVIRPGIYRL